MLEPGTNNTDESVPGSERGLSQDWSSHNGTATTLNRRFPRSRGRRSHAQLEQRRLA